MSKKKSFEHEIDPELLAEIEEWEQQEHDEPEGYFFSNPNPYLNFVHKKGRVRKTMLLCLLEQDHFLILDAVGFVLFAALLILFQIFHG